MALNRSITNTMPGVPTLSGTAGELVTYLDAMLVNGCNSGSCTLSQAAGVATLSRTGHGFVDQQVVEISGATPSAYNGLHRVTYVDANSVTFPIDSGTATPATGTISCKTASLGWTIAYTNTNKRVYQMGAGSLGMVLRVDDTAGVSARIALVRMAESASDVDTLVDQFPLTSQIGANAYFIAKSITASSTVRTTVIAGDEKSFSLLIRANGGTGGQLYYFGEIAKIDGLDSFNCICSAMYEIYASGQYLEATLAMYSFTWHATPSLTTGVGYMARRGDATTKSAPAFAYPPLPFPYPAIHGSSSFTYPKVYGFSRRSAAQPVIYDGDLRGFFRGVYDPMEYLADAGDYTASDFGIDGSYNVRAYRVQTTATVSAGCVLLQTDGELP